MWCDDVRSTVHHSHQYFYLPDRREVLLIPSLGNSAESGKTAPIGRATPTAARSSSVLSNRWLPLWKKALVLYKAFVYSLRPLAGTTRSALLR